MTLPTHIARQAPLSAHFTSQQKLIYAVVYEAGFQGKKEALERLRKFPQDQKATERKSQNPPRQGSPKDHAGVCPHLTRSMMAPGSDTGDTAVDEHQPPGLGGALGKGFLGPLGLKGNGKKQVFLPAVLKSKRHYRALA